MAIHEQLLRQVHRDLREVRWTKARELVYVAQAEGQNLACAPWVHKLRNERNHADRVCFPRDHHPPVPRRVRFVDLAAARMAAVVKQELAVGFSASSQTSSVPDFLNRADQKGGL